MPMTSDTVDTPLPAALPAQPISQDVLMEKYARGDEHCIDDIHRRVARALAQAEKPEDREAWTSRFRQALQDGFLPAGRIQSAAGTTLAATLINCFVQPVGDSITGDDEGHPGIYVALAEAAETMRRGGGVGYDFSRIRPRGAWVAGTQSSASGPVPFMRVFDCSCQTVESAGARRGAQMGVLRCDHPDIEDFIGAKDHAGLTNFNLSVGLTDAFLQAVCDDRSVELVHRAQPGPSIHTDAQHRRGDGLWVYGTRPARALWDRIMRSAYMHAEPGALFLDRINADNNLSWCETLVATNPCGEQPLPPYGACCLGSIDLTRFVKYPFEPAARFDEEGFSRLVGVAVRMLDNVLDITAWPLQRQRQEALGKRRIGLGFTGLGDALVMLNLRYDAGEGRDAAQRIAQSLRDAAYAASCELARERGAFSLFNADLHLGRGTFASRLPEPLKAQIRAHGIRNSHLLSIAPAGTISLAFADNASNGIEPAYAWTFARHRRLPEGGMEEYVVEDHALRLFRQRKGAHAALGPAFVGALQMSAQAHVEMVAAVAPFIDAAISKTVNVPADCTYEDFKDLYMHAWRRGLKGLTTYRPNPGLGAVLKEAVSRSMCVGCTTPMAAG
ncbi:adenosylcobalamin-dependent ribonucleoside-diphosphate reductase [Variovorax sp. 38R]|uniref:adenosylcobalamin-dependent ribonucleoside-diphosphate reductase n=1 Tax=Variovorax sp. 38R TaxID=2774875 RepID=UPI00178754C6|nr:adenosylcobalamin-dependent ribonucleoside-diphosphate reductase [Variovorax sp. 38R]QOF76133.1 adenosylcobalamin-dependent ribonucleoside-diphosphate reductase [Variovorax sp. 38R]